MSAGVGWTVIGQFGSQAIGFLANLALVVPLGPQEFGVIGFAWAVQMLLDALVDFGTGMALVQRPVFTQKLLDTAFSINLVFAGLAMLLVIGLGFVVQPIHTAVDGVTTFDGPATAMVLWQLAPACVFTSLTGIHRSLLQRRLELEAVAKVQFVGAVLRATVAVTMAMAGFGVLSLVVAYYVQAVINVVGYWRLTRQPLHFRFDPEERSRLLRFGVQLTAYNLMNTALQRVDAFVLSATVGQAQFGIFTLARQLMLQTVEIGGLVVRSVLLPRLARLQDRIARARVVYLRCDQVLAGLMLPALVAAATLIDPLAHGVLPAKWAPVGPVAALLLPAAIATILLQSPGSMLMAHARTAAMLRWGLLRGAAMVVACSLGLWLPLSGVAIALGVLLFLALPGLLTEAAALLKVPGRTLFWSVGQLGPATAIALLTSWAVRELCLRIGLPPLAVVAIAGLSCGIAFAGTAWLGKAPIARIAQRLWRRHRRRSAGGRAQRASSSR